MSNIKKIFMWWQMLTKRLLKKASFIILLISIPLLTIGFSVFAEEGGSFITIAIYEEDPADPIAIEITDNLNKESQLIKYIFCESETDAIDCVEKKEADCAWILPSEMGSHIENYVFQGEKAKPFIRIIIREETVINTLSNELLTGAMFDVMAREYYIDFIKNNVPELNNLSEDELLSYYTSTQTPDSLFVFDDIGTTASPVETNLLTSPIKGMLSLVILLTGLATSVYFIKDKELGLFSFIKTTLMPYIELGYELVATVIVSTVVYISLLVMGLLTNPLLEAVSLILYCLSISVFCIVLRAIINNLKMMCVFTPLIVIVTLAVCPIFFNLLKLRFIQPFFPTANYINSTYNPVFMLYMLAYIVIIWLIYNMVLKLKKHNKSR